MKLLKTNTNENNLSSFPFNFHSTKKYYFLTQQFFHNVKTFY